MTRRYTLGPLTMKVIKEQDASREGEFLLCMRRTVPLLEPDNLLAACFKCGDELQYSPSSPKVVNKVCDDCFAVLQLSADKGAEPLITERQIAFIEARKKRRQQ